MSDEVKLHRYASAHATVTWDATRCIHAAEWLEQQLEHPVPGMVMKAGGFPAGQDG